VSLLMNNHPALCRCHLCPPIPELHQKMLDDMDRLVGMPKSSNILPLPHFYKPADIIQDFDFGFSISEKVIVECRKFCLECQVNGGYMRRCLMFADHNGDCVCDVHDDWKEEE